MTRLKNINFKLFAVLLTLSWGFVGQVWAVEQITPFINTIKDADTLLPNAVFIPEKLHKSANKSYKVNGVRYQPQRVVTDFSEEGRASWYGKQFHGRLTSSGERYNMHEMTAAHRTLPIPSYIKVTNLANNKSVVVRINDRGPFHSKRIVDLSYAAAKKLGYANKGVANVKIEQIIAAKEDLVADGLDSTEYVTLKTFEDIIQAQKFLNQVSAKLKEKNLKLHAKMVGKEGKYLIQVKSLDVGNKEKFEKQKTVLLDS